VERFSREKIAAKTRNQRSLVRPEQNQNYSRAEYDAVELLFRSSLLFPKQFPKISSHFLGIVLVAIPLGNQTFSL